MSELELTKSIFKGSHEERMNILDALAKDVTKSVFGSEELIIPNMKEFSSKSHDSIFKESADDLERMRQDLDDLLKW